MKILKSYRKIKKLPTWLFLMPALILKFSKSFLMRTKVIDPYDTLEQNDNGQPYITVTWHNRLLYFPGMFPKRHRKRTFALISPSRDGQYVVDLISHFGVGSVRGSSFKKGAAALRDCEKVLRSGAVLSVTPDGPRGPKYKMSKGPIVLASKTGVPILPVAINTSKYWELRSWDNFQIAKPGSKMNLVLGNPINIPKDLSQEDMEKWRKVVEDRLNEASTKDIV
jgi:lysophospholipid acyltransferase (LPLAT)-like uncharacterized protein